jgi:hypothetical protein
VVNDAGTHPCALDQIHDVEPALTLSVSCLLQTKTLALSDAIDALLMHHNDGRSSLSPAICLGRMRYLNRRTVIWLKKRVS